MIEFMKNYMKITILLICCLFLFACSDENTDPPSDLSLTGDEEFDAPEELIEEAEQNTSTTDDVTATEQDTEGDFGADDFVGMATATGEVVISFEYTRQSGSASNQHAVWIEDVDGNLVKSLFASQWTANGGYRTRPDSIAVWAERADLANMSSAEVDAVAGATPSSGVQSYIWDLTDLHGDAVKKGDYIFFIEGTLRWKNYVLISGIITIGDMPVTVQGEATFHYEESDRHAALTTESGENNMIGPVTAEFIPG